MDIQRQISLNSEILEYILFCCCLMGMIGFLKACDPAPEVPASPAYSTDGVAIHYQVHGAGALSLVFVHGWACDHSYWEQQLQYFSRHYNVVTIDLAGHGRSGLNRDDWTMEAFGKDVKAVVEKLDLDMASVPPEVGVPAIRNLYLRKESQGLNEIPASLKLINSDMQPTNYAAAERYGIDVLQMSDVGHFVMIEDPETFNRLLSEVIEGFAADLDN